MTIEDAQRYLTPRIEALLREQKMLTFEHILGLSWEVTMKEWTEDDFRKFLMVVARAGISTTAGEVLHLTPEQKADRNMRRILDPLYVTTPQCFDTEKSGYMCTVKAGHKGVHVAHWGGGTSIMAWDADGVVWKCSAA